MIATMRTATIISPSPDVCEILVKLSRACSVPKRLVERARIVLMAADGEQNQVIAKKLGLSRPTVQLWRDRFAAKGIAGIEKDAPRPGRKPNLSPTKVRSVIRATLETTPPNATHWSVRSMAKAQKISRMAVQRIWAAHNLKPHRVKTFKLSRDPKFVEKLVDVVGLYLNPPDRALEIDPRDTAAWNNKGNSFYSLDRCEEALGCYEYVLEIDPRNEAACYNKALSEDKIGRNKAAVRSYKKFIELAPPQQYAQQIEYARERIRELRGG